MRDKHNKVIHHLDGNCWNSSKDNIRIVDIKENKRKLGIKKEEKLNEDKRFTS